LSNDEHHHVIRGLVSLGSSNLLGIVFGFLTITIAARNISPDTFGVYSLIIAIINILEVIGNFGIRLSAAKFVASARESAEKQVIVNNILTFRVLSIVLVAILAVLFKPLVLKVYPSTLLDELYFYIPLLFSVQLFEETLAYVMQGYQLFRKMAWVQFLKSGLNAFFVVVLVLALKMGIHGFIIALISSLVITIFVRYRLIPGAKRLQMNVTLLKEIFSFGMPLQGNDILSLIFEKTDVLILGALMGSSSIAYLDMARKLPNYVQSLYQSLQSVYFPYMSEMYSRKEEQQATLVLNHFLRLTSFVSMACALVFTLFQRELIVLVFSETYLPSVPAAGILMFATGIGMISTILDTSLISAGKPAYLLVINLVTAVVNVVTNFALIPVIGFVGGAFARLLANCASTPISGACLWREKIKFNIKDTFLPILLAVLCLGFYYGFGLDTIIERLILIFLFFAASIGFSIIRKMDFLTLISAFRSIRPAAVVEK
jgi:O-antigen/teichoic acid export membrane protein